MTAPNLFLTYVTDAQRSTAFYSNLFDIEPTFTSPRYVAFEVAPGVLFAIWTGHNEHATLETTRTSELGLMLPGGGDAIDEVYQQWVAKGIRVVEEPHDDVFGRTFVIAAPDGNLIRVSPVNWHPTPSPTWWGGGGGPPPPPDSGEFAPGRAQVVFAGVDAGRQAAS
ncbi:VOC family protein, partial [Brevibacterium luteolum]|uniref:VOC family protein n=1 Tax=Brevibacterium luteolum TaxID=199591 RepID=UPI00387966F8